MKEETWKPLWGLVECGERYAVSTLGNVKNVETGKLFNINAAEDRYYKVCFRWEGKRKHYTVHRLVAIAFIPNPENKPAVNHIDGNKQNNELNNLEWCTASENLKHAYSIGLNSVQGEKSRVNKLSQKEVIEIKEMLRSEINTSEIAENFNVSKAAISSIKRGKTWAHVKVDGFVENNIRPESKLGIISSKLSGLTAEQVIEIRASYKPKVCTMPMLAEKFGVTKGVIHRIIKRQTWKHLP